MGLFKEINSKGDNKLTLSAEQARTLVEEHEKLMDKQAIEYAHLISRIRNSLYSDKSFCDITNHIMSRISVAAINGREKTSLSYLGIREYIASDSPMHKYKNYLFDHCNKAYIEDVYWSLIDDYLTDRLGYMVHYETDISLHKTVTISWGKD